MKFKSLIILNLILIVLCYSFCFADTLSYDDVVNAYSSWVTNKTIQHNYNNLNSSIISAINNYTVDNGISNSIYVIFPAAAFSTDYIVNIYLIENDNYITNVTTGSNTFNLLFNDTINTYYSIHFPRNSTNYVDDGSFSYGSNNIVFTNNTGSSGNFITRSITDFIPNLNSFIYNAPVPGPGFDIISDVSILTSSLISGIINIYTNSFFVFVFEFLICIILVYFVIYIIKSFIGRRDRI